MTEIAAEVATDQPRLNWRDLFEGADSLDAADVAELDEYFVAFLPPSETCWKCGLRQGGLLGALMGGFRWSIVHGEGNCSGCGWPARAYHRNIGPVEFLNMILQYHPNCVTTGEEEEG